MSTTQSISRESLGEIAAIACQGWKTKLAEYACRNPYGNMIEFTQAEVDEMFKAAEPNQKPVLLKFFKQADQGIMERVTSYETACKELGITPDPTASSYDRLKTIIRALNEGWAPDWENENQLKWYKSKELALHCQKIADAEYKDYLLNG